METFGNTLFSTAAKNLLTQLRAGDIPLQEFLMECAYWALKDGFDDLRPLAYPTAPNTEAFREFDLLSPDRKLKVDQSFFYKNYEINDYYRQVVAIRNYNQGILDWLNEVKGYLPEGEPLIEKIDSRILEFQAAMDEQPVMAAKIKSTFQAREIKPWHRRYAASGIN